MTYGRTTAHTSLDGVWAKIPPSQRQERRSSFGPTTDAVRCRARLEIIGACRAKTTPDTTRARYPQAHERREIAGMRDKATYVTVEKPTAACEKAVARPPNNSLKLTRRAGPQPLLVQPAIKL